MTAARKQAKKTITPAKPFTDPEHSSTGSVEVVRSVTKTIDIPEAVASRRCFLKVCNWHEELRSAKVTKTFQFICFFGI